MESKEIRLGRNYKYTGYRFATTVYIIEYVEFFGYWVKDVDGEYFWADAEELEEVL